MWVFNLELRNQEFEEPAQHFPRCILERDNAGDLGVYFDELLGLNLEVDTLIVVQLVIETCDNHVNDRMQFLGLSIVEELLVEGLDLNSVIDTEGVQRILEVMQYVHVSRLG